MNIYVVKEGDTFMGIANQHGVTFDALKAANPDGGNWDEIRPGQRLVIPPSTSHGARPPQGPQGVSTYTVKVGDTLSDIAQRHGVQQDALQMANPQIGNPDELGVGQVIRIPVKP